MNRTQRSTLQPKRHQFGHFLTALVVATILLTACGAPPAPPSPPSATYETRGIIRKLPPANEVGEVLIAHEKIDHFTDQDGKTVGMPAMTMPFHLGIPDRATGVGVGDRIALTFGVRWSDGPPLEILDLQRLGADVRLEFEQPAPPANPEPEAEAAPEQ